MKKSISIILLVLVCLNCTARPVLADEPQEGPRIVNLVNFIRGVEPRGPVDLVEPIREQIRLGRENGLPTTFLVQYDAMLNPAMVDLLKNELGPNDELGAWIEVVQPQVEAIGLEWHGRFPWDWHTDVGFTVGYTPEQRRLLMDEYMRKFEEVFETRPTSVGCWIIDAPTLNYLVDEYDITAACICKDQSGTDGYTLWGGYWSGAYYPSRLNAFMPAQTEALQLNVPVFRMLGSDPTYQYDTSLGNTRQGVISLEPVYGGSGGDPAWVQWFCNIYWNEPCLAFSYTQAGQENSFGWGAMRRGLEFQYPYLAGASHSGAVRVETLAESAAWFREQFDVTPASAVVALEDWRGGDRQSIWYESAHYRMSLLSTPEGFRVRDIHLFDENYPGRYLHDRVDTHQATFDTLPIVDGYNWSDRNGVLAGIRLVTPTDDGGFETAATGELIVMETASDTLAITIPIDAGGEITILCTPQALTFEVTGEGAPEDWALTLSWAPNKETAIDRVGRRAIAYQHNGYDYRLNCTSGEVRTQGESMIVISPRDSVVRFEF